MTPPERLTLRSIGSDFLRDFTQAEKGLWGTIVQLTVRPRRVLDTFLYESRQQFSRPTRYLIFCLSIAAFQFIAVQWRYGVSVVEYNETLEEGTEAYQGPIEAFAQGYSTGRGDKKISVKEIAAYASYISVIFIPAYAFMYFFLFPARSLNYAESLAGTTYLHGHFILITALLSLPFLAFSGIADFAQAKNWIETAATALLVISIFRTFLSSKRDALWMVPKLLLSIVWAVPFSILLGITVSAIMSLFIPDMNQIPYGFFLFFILILFIVLLLTGRLLLLFRTRWPSWYIWVPTVLVAFGIYAMLIFSWVTEASS
jgi:hypothetical protein